MSHTTLAYKPSALGATADAVAIILPGVALTALLAAAATALHRVPGLSHFSPLILAIILGALFHNLLRSPAAALPGIGFSLRRVLRLGVVLLGLQLTLQNIVTVGPAGLAVIVATLAITFVGTKLLGRAFGVERRLAELIAAGTAVCGASAVIATNTVTEGSDEDVAYAVACVTLFGTAAMFLYPALPAVLHLSPRAYGLWAGA
ncbi:MAG TPA: putative sulfate exporter family transporter, partial [Acetobacteraceae bacterium]|nr:putative sulfate exporter family transporter [Acetobacteraceae bacterium]